VARVTFQATVISERNASAALGGVQRPRSLDAEDDEGTEMKIIDHRRPVQFITRATFDIPQTPVDSTIEFPTFREHTTKLEKSKINVNGTEGTNSLPFPQYNNVKCVMNGPSNVYSVMSWPSPNISMGTYLYFPLPIRGSHTLPTDIAHKVEFFFFFFFKQVQRKIIMLCAYDVSYYIKRDNLGIRIKINITSLDVYNFLFQIYLLSILPRN
jgi:hypothetical protein